MQTRHSSDPRLARIRILADCDRTEFAAVDLLSTVVEVPADKVLMNQDAFGNEFMMLIEGGVEVTVADERIAMLGPGDIFGEIALLIDVPRTATVRTVSPSTLAVVPRGEFELFLREAPNATRRLLRTVATRQFAMHQRLQGANACVTALDAIRPTPFAPVLPAMFRTAPMPAMPTASMTPPTTAVTRACSDASNSSHAGAMAVDRQG